MVVMVVAVAVVGAVGGRGRKPSLGGVGSRPVQAVSPSYYKLKIQQ